MRGILVDENLPPRLAKLYRRHSIESLHVYDLALDSQSDGSVWTMASRMEFAVATKDDDFAELATLSASGKVILFAVGNMRIRWCSHSQRSTSKKSETSLSARTKCSYWGIASAKPRQQSAEQAGGASSAC
jgi:predicted nuclease of predicted toxin-antitoxin system